jgi:hypothetical protein
MESKINQGLFYRKIEKNPDIESVDFPLVAEIATYPKT